jgi:uncharacterized protein YuzB (UPF0349 family)
LANKGFYFIGDSAYAIKELSINFCSLLLGHISTQILKQLEELSTIDIQTFVVDAPLDAVEYLLSHCAICKIPRSD